MGDYQKRKEDRKTAASKHAMRLKKACKWYFSYQDEIHENLAMIWETLFDILSNL